MYQDTYHLVALTEVETVGPVMANRLLEYFKDPESVFRASEHDLMMIEGMTRQRVKKIKGFSDWKRVENILRVCEKKSIKIVDIFSKDYPEQLKNIADPPPVIYVKGKLTEEDRLAIAVVGPRRASTYGRAVTEDLVSELSFVGITIVSGMARGIDTVAHRTSIENNGRTIAVLGSGVDVPYPPENKTLLNNISLHGAVVSEFPPGTKPDRGNFPRRNRIISGLSLGVLVVEATTDSGSLITARFALEQNREVFAVPGKITSKLSAGTNELIKKGAKPVLKAEDIIEELSAEIKGILKQRDRAREKITLTNEEATLLSLLSDKPVHVDDLTRQASLPLYRILGRLTSLELKGLVKQTAGKRFFKVREV